MSALFIILFVITIALAFYINNRPIDQGTRNAVNIILIIVSILVALGLLGIVGELRIR